MAKAKKIEVDPKLNEQSDKFLEKINSQMHYKSDMSNDAMNFEWIDEIDFALPYLDNIVRNPKVALIKEEDIVKVEKAKKITVASVKDLSRNTHYIDKVDEVTEDVQPNKILIERSEETFNTYENRLVYTLIVENLRKFVMKKEKDLENLDIKDDKVLEYAASTVANGERINIELKINANELPNTGDEDDLDKKLKEELEEKRKKMERIKLFLSSWMNSEFISTLLKANVPFLTPPIRKNNVILKNPNFQVAMKLWIYLQTFDLDNDDVEKEGLDTTGNNVLKGILDDAFLMNYFVLDSISSSKRAQKEKLTQYAIVMVHQQIQRVISILLNSGIDISDEEMLEMILGELKKERNKSAVDSADVKDKFKNAFEEYLEKAQNYL